MKSPLQYQMSESDFGRVSLLNCISYLFDREEMPLEFVKIMFPPFIVAIALITACCLVFVKSEPLVIKEKAASLPTARVIVYLVLFALSILIVFNVFHYLIGVAVITLALMFLDRRALLEVDYGLLFTFVFFFIFSGNMARIDAVRNFFSYLLEKNTLVVSALSCQFISNVPSAILLSQFTDNYKELLLGVNIQGIFADEFRSLKNRVNEKAIGFGIPDRIR